MNANEVGTHMSHCYQDEYLTTCKYGDTDCPAKPRREIMKREQLQLESFKAIAADNDCVHIDAWDSKAQESVTVAVTCDDLNFDEQKQVAAVIVTALNSHEKLIEGCKKALTCASLNSDVRALIVAALASAEAGTAAAGGSNADQRQAEFQERLRQTMLSNPLVKEVDLSDL